MVAATTFLASATSPAYSTSCVAVAYKPDKQTSSPDLFRTNVPTCDGRFVSGFKIVGNGGATWYADAHHANECFNMDVTFLPAGVSAYDMDEVQEYLGDEVDVDVWRRVEVVTCK